MFLYAYGWSSVTWSFLAARYSHKEKPRTAFHVGKHRHYKRTTTTSKKYRLRWILINYLIRWSAFDGKSRYWSPCTPNAITKWKKWHPLRSWWGARAQMVVPWGNLLSDGLPLSTRRKRGHWQFALVSWGFSGGYIPCWTSATRYWRDGCSSLFVL